MKDQVVYVVLSADEYEDGVYGIFSSRERAEEWIAKQWRPQDYKAVEWEMDTDCYGD